MGMNLCPNGEGHYLSFSTLRHSNRRIHAVAPLGYDEAIRRIGGEAFDDTATEIDDSLLSHDLPGMTDRDFKPRTRRF
jgi:hypothetical protein